MGRGGRDEGSALIRPRAPVRKILGLAAAGVFALATVGVWQSSSRSTALLGWNSHLVPEQRKVEREMVKEIAKGGMANTADKSMVEGLVHKVESLKAIDAKDAKVLASDEALKSSTLVADKEAFQEDASDTAYKKALSDADSVLDGAPDVVKKVIGDASRAHAARATNALNDIDQAAKEEYRDTLEGYERLEEGMAPREVVEMPSQMEMDAKKDRRVLEQQFKAPGTKQQLDKASPAVVKQMIWDMKHPSAEERKIERVMSNEIAQPGKANPADKALIAGLEHKVESLEALNSKVALTKAPPGENSKALEHAEKVAAQAARAQEKKAMAFTESLVPKGPKSSALLHAEAVARKAAAAEVNKEELVTKKFLKKKVKVDKLKMLGVKEDHIGGVRHALVAGQKSAKKIPGVREDTWPFAPGSFKYARKHPLPGVNEASWEVIPDFEGPQTVSKTFKAHDGGCFPDGKGGLKCHGEQEKWMKKVKGWDENLQVPKQAPGTSLAMLLPHLREDAKQQKLEAAAEAFSDSMKEQGPARTEELLLQGAKKARLQSLEQVAEQCSNFLDCLAMQGTVVPQYTNPKYGAEDDRIVRTQEQSLSHTAVRDAFNPELRPWRLVSKWPFEAGDRMVKMPKGYIGKISRPSVSSHHKSHMKYDVPAAELPGSAMTSMYATERKELKGQALAAENSGTLPELMSLWEESSASSHQEQLEAQMLASEKPEPANNPVKPGARGLGMRNYENTVGLCKKGINCDSSSWPFGEQDSMSDALVDAQRVQEGGLGTAGPWTPMMYTGNKPTSYDPGAAYIPDYQFLANRRRSVGFPRPMSQMLRLQQQVQPQMRDEVEVEPESKEGPVECPVCESCAEEDEECMAANSECFDERTSCIAFKCGNCEEGDEECEQAKDVCEAEAECLEGDQECIAAARGGFWSAMTGHIEKNEKQFEHVPRPQHQGAHKWNLPGVNVDSGWMPYKHADVWGYDRRPGARSPDPEQGGEDEAVHPAANTGLISAAVDLPKSQWNAWDHMEHSDHNRAIRSIKHAWHSIVGGKEEKAETVHEVTAAQEPEQGVEKAGVMPDGEEAAYDWEKGTLYSPNGGEETSTAEKVHLFEQAPSLQQMQKEDGALQVEREAEAQRKNALKEQEQLDHYLQQRFGERVSVR